MNSAPYQSTVKGVTDYSITEWIPKTKTHRFRVIVQEEGGEYSAVALNLPGLATVGDTFDEALANFHDAAVGILESYGQSGDDIPWKNTQGMKAPVGAEERWITIDA